MAFEKRKHTARIKSNWSHHFTAEVVLLVVPSPWPLVPLQQVLALLLLLLQQAHDSKALPLAGFAAPKPVDTLGVSLVPFAFEPPPPSLAPAPPVLLLLASKLVVQLTLQHLPLLIQLAF